MIKSDQGALARFFVGLPNIMNSRIPGLDFLDTRLKVPKKFDELFTSKSKIDSKGFPTVRPRSTAGVLGTFVREGILKQGENAPFSVCGKDFFIYDNAWIMGEVRVGVRARVTGVVRKRNERFATKILVIGEGAPEDASEVDGKINPLN